MSLSLVIPIVHAQFNFLLIYFPLRAHRSLPVAKDKDILEVTARRSERAALNTTSGCCHIQNENTEDLHHIYAPVIVIVLGKKESLKTDMFMSNKLN